jgi:hypothetical protein
MQSSFFQTRAPFHLRTNPAQLSTLTCGAGVIRVDAGFVSKITASNNLAANIFQLLAGIVAGQDFGWLDEDMTDLALWYANLINAAFFQ